MAVNTEQSNRLQLNCAKTEVLWCAYTSSRRQHQIPRSGTRIGADDVMLSTFVRDLGIYIDAVPCGRMSWRQSRSASPFYVIFVVHADLFRKRSCRHSSSHLYWLSWTMETRHSLDSQIRRSLNCNWPSMLPLVWFSCRVSLITLRRFYVNYIDCPFLRGLITSWRCWFSSASMVWHSRISPANSVVWLTQSRQRLHSASTAELIIPRVRPETIGGRAFLVVAAKVWNSLPSSLTSSSSLKVFKSRLKTELFTRCYWVDQHW